MRKNILVTPIAMVLVAGATTLSAQDMTNGTLAGRVTGPNGQGLQGVTVILNSPSLLAPRQFTTDANGQFRAQMLVGGNYTVTYTLSGYLTRRMTTYIAAGQIIRGDMQLRPLDVQTETVEIVATSSQQVDKTDTVVQSSLSQQKLIELTGGASIDALLSITPGAFKDGNEYRMRGGTKVNSKILVDGSNVTNMAEGVAWGITFPMTDIIESIAIIQSPLNARYGNTDGGLVSFVLSKGSNDFKGTLRVSPGRSSIWNVIQPSYPNNRTDISASLPTPGSDNLSKNYRFYLTGPLWKDHITFSWTSENTPTTRSIGYQYQSTNGIWVSGWGDNIDKSRYRQGTYFQASNGEVIRKAEMLEADDPWNIIPMTSSSRNDTYTLFYQITQNHQIEWSYSEIVQNYLNNTNATYNMADYNANPNVRAGDYGNQRRWNLAYKGIIGSNGLLEARMSNFTQAWTNVQVDLRPKHAVRVLTLPSLYPINPNGNVLDPNNYYASGLIDAVMPRNDGIKDSRQGGPSYYTFNANNEGPGDTLVNQPINVNYQHILETKHFGRHIFDVGFQRDRSSWVNPNLYGTGDVNAERLIRSPGRINIGLTSADILNYQGTNPSQYAGRFIVYNMNYATFRSVDPYGASRFNSGGQGVNDPRNLDERLIDYDNGDGWGRLGSTPIWPLMFEQYGGSYQDVLVQQMSYYLNDLWTINDHHSVMGGVRFDNYSVWSSAGDRDIFSYSLPTFRFEYKFDIQGNQKRVVNVSYGQFHGMAPISTWAPFINRGIREMVWNVGPTDGKPYLETFDAIMNSSNYRVIADNLSGGVNKVADDFKGQVSTELTAGIRFNLDNGGSLRITYVNRGLNNAYAYVYNDWVDNPNDNGKTKSFSRLLKNIDVERSYNSLELEWYIPVTKKTDFGGSYTFARQMENGNGESNSSQKSANKNVYWNEYYDQYDYPHWGYNPVRLQQPEHRFNAYLNYNMNYGKVRSNVAFRFAYNSSGPGHRTYGYDMGYPVVPGVTTNKAGDAPAGRPTMPQNTNVSYGTSIYYNIHRMSSIDSWSTNLAYNLDVPITHRVYWFLNLSMGNPFNHRAKSGWYSLYGWMGFGSVTPETINHSDGRPFIEKENPYAGGLGMSGYGQAYGYNLFAPNQVQGGRSIGFSTGLRF